MCWYVNVMTSLLTVPLSTFDFSWLEKGTESWTTATLQGRDEFRCFINSVIALAFVPPTFVRVAWRGLMGEAPAFGNREDFFQYFQNTWLDGNFPIRMWNVYSLEGPRTNNNTEGWHSKLRKLAGKAHAPQYLWSCHPLQIRAGSHRSMYHAVGCRQTVNQEEEEIQTAIGCHFDCLYL